MKKNDRLFAIKNLILTHDIATQQELMDLLKKEGFQSTQATLSRDIKELNLIKVSQLGRTTKYAFYHDVYREKSLYFRLEKSLRNYGIKVISVQFLVILLVAPTYPNIIASLIDELKLPAIAGTIASFDTCLIILNTDDDAHLLSEIFSKVIHDQSLTDLEKAMSPLVQKQLM